MNHDRVIGFALILLTAIWSQLTPQAWYVDAIVFVGFAMLATALDQ